VGKTWHTLPLARSARPGGSARGLPEQGGRCTGLRRPRVPPAVAKAQGPRRGGVLLGGAVLGPYERTGLAEPLLVSCQRCCNGWEMLPWAGQLDASPNSEKLSEAHCATHEILDPCPQIDEFALDGQSSVSGNNCTATPSTTDALEAFCPPLGAVSVSPSEGRAYNSQHVAKLGS
jgi:hypothetical protein